MHRTIVSAGVLLTFLTVATPAQAQRYQWNVSRPDGHAPAGVKADFTLPKGEIYLGYRYFEETFRGTVIGTDDVTSDDVLDFFTVATPSYNRTIHEFEIRYGLTNWGTVEASVPYFRNDVLKETDALFFETSSDVLGDISIRGLFDLLEMDEYRLTLTLGGTVPTGKLRKRGPTVTESRGVLPFIMQGGSGTPDLLVGGTFQVQNDQSSVGAQFNSVIRFMDNGFDYRLGNRYDFSVWGAYNISDWVSFSARGFFEHWGSIEGNDPQTNGAEDPLANPFAQGGERVVIPFGINIFLREGRATGHRLSLEYYYLVHEDLNGPQISLERTLVVSWQILTN